MANAAILIEWGMPRDGREHKALEIFFAAVASWEAWKAAGRIESYQTFGVQTGNVDTRAGFVIVQGSTEQITALEQSEDYRQQLVKVIAIGTNIQISVCETGDAMATRMQRYGTVLKGMGI